MKDLLNGFAEVFKMKNDDMPRIGVLALIDDERESWWMLPGYMEGIMQAGGIPVMLPVTDDRAIIRYLADDYDGFLFTGGHDVSPGLYGEEPAGGCVISSSERDEMEKFLFELVYEADKPMLGICRGIQFFNACMGGTLWQDLPSQRSSNIMHHQHAPYDVPAHSVEISEGTPLYTALDDLLDKGILKVNSYHHQAVKDLAPKLKCAAKSEDGLCEAVYDESRRFLWAVQWHPEFSYKTEESSRRIFKGFVNACKDYFPEHTVQHL